MNDPYLPPHRQPALRRLVLGVAILAALALAAGLSVGRHPDDRSVPAGAPFVGFARAADTPAAPRAPEPPSVSVPTPPPEPVPGASAGPAPLPSTAADGKASDSPLKAGAEITIDEKGIRIEGSGTDGRRSRHIVVRGTADGDLDALHDLVNQRKWVVTLVFFVVALVFLVPLLAVALVVWYKMRRTRMLNQTLVLFAEKGIPPPPEALHALGGSAAAAAMQSLPPSTPMYEQAKVVRKRVAWSDLRKGVLMTAVGLGLALYSMLEDGSANVLGLVLLFVGIGYVVLWFLEDRHSAIPRSDVPPGGA